MYNLGTRQGKMLMFLAGEEKEISKELVNIFEKELEYYVGAGMLEVVTKKKAPMLKDNQESTPVVKKKQTTKKATKKRTRVSKE
jgi:hypothetical protein